MKILSIFLENINSLKGPCSIELESYVDNNAQIMAITGPTGSGKTSILDAICAALYGRTPRLGKPSDMAELMTRNTAHCLAEVTFSINKKKYRSRYERHRAYKKVTGNLRDATMELVDLETDKIIATRSKVPLAVEKITGLDFNRFCKSILLAQGNFDAFLKARNDERALLLENITGTQIYSLISTKTYEKAKEEKEKLQKIRNRLSMVELLSADQISEITLKISGKKKEADQLRKEQKKLIHAQNYLNSVEECQKTKEKCLQKLSTLEKQQKEAAPKLELLLKANQTTLFIEPYQEIRQTQKTCDEFKKQITALEKQIPDIEKKLKNTENEKAQIQMSQAELKKEAEEKKAVFESFRNYLPLLKDKNAKKADLINQIEELKVEQKDLKRKLKKAEKKFHTHIQLISNLNKEQAQLKESLDVQTSKLNTLLTEGSLEALEKQKKELDSLYSDLIRKKGLFTDIENTPEEIKNIDDEINNLKLASGKKQKLLKEASLYLNNIRADIKILHKQREYEIRIQKLDAERSELVKDEPCPLCGSTDHPFRKNVPKKTRIALQLETREKELEQQSIYREKLQQTTLEMSNRIETMTCKINDLKLILNKKNQELEKIIIPGHETDSLKTVMTAIKVIDQQTESLTEKILSINKTNSLIHNTQKQVQTKTDELYNAEISNQQISSTIELDKEKFDSTQKACGKLQSQVDQICKETEHIYNTCEEKDQNNLLDSNAHCYDPEKIEKQINQLTSELSRKKESRDKQLEKLQTDFLEIQSTLLAKTQELDACNNSHEKHRSTLIKLTENFLISIQKRGFTDLDHFKKYLLEPDELKELQDIEKTLSSRKIELQTLQKDNDRKLHSLLNNPAIDLSKHELEQKILLSDQSIEEVNKSLAEFEHRLKENRSLEKKHKDLLERESAQIKECNIWSSLNELIGQKDGAKFRLFAQRLTLEQLIYKANQYLKLFNHRYILEASRSLDLDIMVIDTFFGDGIRPIENLSGGETFLISLSLALGLSDITSSHTNIESLFLDEGFGTLDKDSLETALAAIDTLNAFGKTICIISHVEALKERIPLKIEVTPVSDGTSKLHIVS